MGSAKCSAGCKEEFKRSNFLLTHVKPYLFVTSQWSNCACSGVFYVVWRAMTAILFTSTVIVNGISYIGNGDLDWFVHQTSWSNSLLAVDTIVQFALASYGFWFYRREKSWEGIFGGVMPWYLKMTWVLTNISSAANLQVTVMYWSIIYTPDVVLTAEGILIHAINSVYVIINVFITATPVRVYHVFHLWIYTSIYAVFSVVYSFASGGKCVYSVLDWVVDPAKAAVYAVLASIPGPLMIWTVYYGFYRLRLVVFKATLHNHGSSERDAEGQGHDIENIYKEEAMGLDSYNHRSPLVQVSDPAA